jgi:hypothetical protein
MSGGASETGGGGSGGSSGAGSVTPMGGHGGSGGGSDEAGVQGATDASDAGGGDEVSADAAIADGPIDSSTSAVDVVDAGPTTPVPILYLPFDETVGAVAVDSSGHDRNATAIGGYSWVAGKKGNAIKLDGVSGYVSLPAGIVSSVTDMTIATWVQLDVAVDWQRIIDFGNNSTVQMFLVPQNKETGVMRFALTTSGKTGQQVINGPLPLPTGVWKHVAMVLRGQSAELYVDGSNVASMSGFSLHPSSMGNTSNNWIGRSQLAVDPYFKGTFDEFRIYDSALSAAQIVALVND